MQILTINKSSFPNLRQKRVAAYARVSADKDEAYHSLDQQISYYNDYISKRPDWAFAGIYGDEGISGTTEERPGYQKMMKDARAGKFDLIVTKSITRLARNTVTLLKTVRELKGLDIDVYFEKEDLHSISPEGEMMLTMLAMYAEEEARSASENKRWQIKRSFEKGKPTFFRVYGYRWVDGTLEVVPEEAEVVRRIFALYLDGKGLQAIAKIIKKEWKNTGKAWKASTIFSMLRNEKYKGDLLLQKTHIPDYRDKKRFTNYGQWRQYLVEDAHEAIISPEMYDKVQEEIVRRKRKVPVQKDFSEKLFNKKIVCGCCGCYYSRKKRRSCKGEYYIWICNNFNVRGKEACCSKLLIESVLIDKTKEVLGMLLKEKLTREIIEEKIEYIEARPEQKLRFFLGDGRVETVEWEVPSRSNSWTPEMREKARQKTLARVKAKKAAA